MKIRFKVGNSLLIAIAVNALTEEDEQAESEKFYEALQDQLDRANKKDFLIVLGDFNARVGRAFSTSRFHGSHNTDVRNMNGTRLVDFCYNNGLVITNTIFPHKNIHQWTRYHPNQRVGHTVDYVPVKHQYRAQVFDTRASRKTVHISDHNIIITKIIIKSNKKNLSQKYHQILPKQNKSK